MIQVRAEFTLDAGDELTWCYDPNDDFSDVFEKYTRLLCSHSRLAHAHRREYGVLALPAAHRLALP